jgi:glycosyltransferase involved in cell wall biosynthesis
MIPESRPDTAARKVKVLYVITRAEHGGAQVHIRDLFAMLKSEVDPVIATGEDGFLCDEAQNAGVRVHRMKHLVRPIRPWTDLRAIAELSAIIRDEKPDLVHTHTSKAGIVGRAAAAITGTPRVFTAHTWSFVEGDSRIQSRLATLAERFAAKLGGPMIMVSQANRKLALMRRIGHPKQLITVWNGMPDSPHRAQHGPKEIPHIVMVARFAAQKDHATLLRALAGIDLPWALTFAGDGPLRAETQALAAQLGIADRVAFPGATDRVGELLARSDIFVLSTFFEGLPISILEGMRAGLPIITTNVGGSAEAVTEGVNGYLVDIGDIGEMRKRLVSLLEDPGLRLRFGAASRARFEQDFRLEKTAASTLAVYRTALGWSKREFAEQTQFSEQAFSEQTP